MTSPQQQVAQLVADRGYREGWTLNEFASRQIAKLTEELGELSTCLHHNWSPWWESLNVAHRQARHAFNAPTWDRECLMDYAFFGYAKEELADIQVVVFTLAQALSELSDEPFDVVQAALDKAGKDVERGVRKDG